MSTRYTVEPGSCYIVATPIGNLGDMTARAVSVLQQVDSIVAEDTRHSKKLLQYLQINKPLISMHEHNEAMRIDYLCELLQQGKSLALISDAGTPLISDPGYQFVTALRQQNFPVIPIPGACALITALSAAGLATDRFIFEGFLAAKTEKRRKHLMALQNETRTVIFYESPHRIIDSLQTMQDVFADTRQIVLAHELTKLYESFTCGTAVELLAWLEEDKRRAQGEFIILIGGAKAAAEEEQDFEKILSVLLKELPLKQAVQLTCDITGLRRNKIYEYALQQKVNSTR